MRRVSFESQETLTRPSISMSSSVLLNLSGATIRPSLASAFASSASVIAPPVPPLTLSYIALRRGTAIPAVTRRTGYLKPLAVRLPARP